MSIILEGLNDTSLITEGLDGDIFIYDVLINALINCQNIINWCNTNYNGPPTIYKGIDIREPPPDTSYPIIHLFPISREKGYNISERNYLLGIVLGLCDTTLNTTTTGDDVIIKEYQGIDNIEDFRALVETCIVDAMPVNDWIDSINITYNTIDAFPFFLCSNFYTITNAYLQGNKL